MIQFDQTFEGFRQQSVEAIDRAIEGGFKRFSPERGLAEDRVLTAAKHSVNAGGKRMRGLLVLCSSGLCQSNIHHAHENALCVAASIELMHAYSLIHDDLPSMDDSPLRRGQPSTHVAFDEATAILAGDGLQALSFHILGSGLANCDPADALAVVAELAKAAGFEGMVGGQMLDILAENAERRFDLATTKRLQAKKTGALLRYSCRAGAMLHGERGDILNHLDRFGARIGLSFQIVDDLLDATASSTVTGKPVSADANKATFIDLLGEQGARAEIKRLTVDALETIELLRDLARTPLQQAAINQLCHMAEFIAKRSH